MRDWRFCRALRVLVALAGSGLGASAVQAETLRGVVQQAISTNPLVLGAHADRRAADHQLDAALGGYLPQLDVIDGLSREQLDSRETQLLGLQTDSYERHEATATLSQMLFDGFGTPRTVDRADALLESAAYTVLDQAQLVALDTVEAYLDVLRRQRTVQLARDNLAAHTRIREMIELRSTGGLGRRSDMEQADSRYALATANLRQEQASLEDAHSRYRRLVGRLPQALEDPAAVDRPLPAPWTLAAATADKSPEGMDVGSTAVIVEPQNAPPTVTVTAAPDAAANARAIEDALAVALDAHPAVRAAQAGVDAASAQVGVARAVYSPRLSAEFSSGYAEDRLREQSEDLSAGLRLRWNLFNGARDRAGVGQATAQLDSASERLEQVRRQVAENLAQSGSALLASRDRLVALQRYARAISAAQEAYELQFSIGQRSLLDLVNAQDEQFSAKAQEVTAFYTEKLAVYRVHAAMGDLLGALGVQLNEADSADASR